MLTPKIMRFLDSQKARMVELDRTQGADRDPNSPRYYDEKTGKIVSGLEVLYDNTIQWLNGREAFETLYKEFQILENTIHEDTLATDTPNSGIWTTQALPLVRRLFNNIVARELVSIQPITNPSAYIFYLNKVYGTTYAADSIVGGTTRLDQSSTSAYSSSSEGGTIREIEMSLQR